jgi:hypothetical protein
MASLAEKSAAEKSNFKNSSDARNGNGHVLQRQRHSFALVLTTTETTRKTDRETATTATEKTTLNQVHSGPKVGSTSVLLSSIFGGWTLGMGLRLIGAL